MRKAIFLKVTSNLWERLNNYAERMGITKTTIVILALESYLSKNELAV